ncbi:MAG: DoxX family protein [Bacteroidota bacterium]
MIAFGANKFLQFIQVAPPVDPTAQQFMGAMFSSYLFAMVALAEIIGGLLLLSPRFRFAGWLILLPIVFNIVVFHLAYDFIGNGIWLVPTIIYLMLANSLSDRIQDLFQVLHPPLTSN